MLSEVKQTNDEHWNIFREHRGLLFGIAYRMLGSVMDAEDILQDSYLAWTRTRPETVAVPVAFLRTLVTRRCLDFLKSARVRRETYVGPWLPEPLLTGPPGGHVQLSLGEDVAEVYVREEQLGENLSTAFLILLESLSPAERAVYLLRETFNIDFAEIAEILEKSQAHCRQLLHRARSAVQQRRTRFAAPPAETVKRLLEQFLQAVRSGDLNAFAGVLAEDVRLHSDGGGIAKAALNIVVGRDNVARFHLGIQKHLPADLHLEIADVNGEPGLLLYTPAGLHSVLSLGLDEQGRIADVYTMRNPEKMRHLQVVGLES